MAATLINAILAAKDILQILHLKHQDFEKGSCMKLIRAKGGFHPILKLGTLLKTNIQNLSIQRKWTMHLPP